MGASPIKPLSRADSCAATNRDLGLTVSTARSCLPLHSRFSSLQSRAQTTSNSTSTSSRLLFLEVKLVEVLRAQDTSRDPCVPKSQTVIIQTVLSQTILITTDEVGSPKPCHNLQMQPCLPRSAPAPLVHLQMERALIHRQVKPLPP